MSTSAPAATHTAAARPADRRSPQRVRHEPRRRTLTITQVEKIAAHMIRVTLTGDLEDFKSLGFDDHIRLFFPDGTTNADGAPNMLARDFTPRRYDPTKTRSTIDFAIHDAGPATRWAAQVQPGQTLSIGGPRGSCIIPTTYDWHLLIADETGLPAIGRRLAELPAGRGSSSWARSTVRPTRSPSRPNERDHNVGAPQRRGSRRQRRLAETLSTMKLPAGDYYAWVACELLTAKALRRQLIADARRQSEMDPRRRRLAPRVRCRARGARQLIR